MTHLISPIQSDVVFVGIDSQGWIVGGHYLAVARHPRVLQADTSIWMTGRLATGWQPAPLADF